MRVGVLRELCCLTVLEVLNPASFISALAKLFLIRKIKYDFFKTDFISAQNEPCISSTQNHCSKNKTNKT